MESAIARPRAGLPILDRLDSRLVQELALDVDEPTDILARYGIDAADQARLLADPILKIEVEALRAELKRAGHSAKVKARLAAEELIGTVYIRASKSECLADALDALKVLAKIGDLEPRDTAGKVTGTIVRVDLSIGQLGFNHPVPAPREVVNVECAEVVMAPGDGEKFESQNLEVLVEGLPGWTGPPPELVNVEWDDGP